MKATPFLMFQGDAKAALALYAQAFPDFEPLLRQEHEGGEQAGQVALARFRLGGPETMLSDSPPVHDFTFTPATSIYIACDDEDQLRRLADVLARDGAVLMPIDNYGFSALFTWIVDQFGVSWQLNLEQET